MTAASPEIELFTIEGPSQRVHDVTEAFACLLGRPVSEVSGKPLADLLYPEDEAEVTARVERLDDEAVTLESRFVQSNGQAIYVQWVTRRLADGRWRATGTDTADLVKLLADRRDLRTRLDLAVGQSVVAMWDFDLAAGTFAWEAHAAGILGVEDLPATVADLGRLVHPADREALEAAFARMLSAGSAETGLRVGAEHTLRHLSFRGRVLDHAALDAPNRAVGLLLDVTVEKALEEQLLRMSVSDALTGIRNRRGFDQSLRGEWRRCRRAGEPLSIVMLDVDHFKTFNDTYGHVVGDQALVAITRALGAALHREGDGLARYGGEEFAVVLPGADPAAADTVADRLLAAVREVRLRQAPDWRFSVSIGISTWSPDEPQLRATELVARADASLYAAKRDGRDRVGAR